MPSSDLCYLSADDAVKAFKAKTLAPVDLMSAVIAQAEAVEPRTNALTFRHFDKALDAAKSARPAICKVPPVNGRVKVSQRAAQNVATLGLV